MRTVTKKGLTLVLSSAFALSVGAAAVGFVPLGSASAAERKMAVLHTAPSAVQAVSDLEISAFVRAQSAPESVTLYYSADPALGYLSIEMAAGDAESEYIASVPAGKLLGDRVSYYIEAGSGAAASFATAQEPVVRAVGGESGFEDTPTLVITEIAQRGSYEFFELYNNSDAAVDLSDYTIRYISGMYSDYANATVSVTYAEKTVGSMPADGAMLGAGETAVFWCNGDGAAIIAEEEKAFNDNYGLSGDSALTAGVNLFSFGTSMPDTNGKSGKNSRGFSVAAKESGEIVTQAFFNLNPDGTQLEKNGTLVTDSSKSVLYSAQAFACEALAGDGWSNTFQQIVSYNDYDANPGTVARFQAASAEEAPAQPQIVTASENSELVYAASEDTLDVTSLFAVNALGYESSDYTVSATVTAGAEEWPASALPAAEGDYELQVTVEATGGAFEAVEKTLAFSLAAETVTNEMTLSHTPAESVAAADGLKLEAEVAAEIADSVESIKVLYRIDENYDWAEREMTLENGKYVCTFSASDLLSDEFSYKFEVSESALNQTVEFTDGGEPYSVAVTGVERAAQASAKWTITEINQRTSYEFFEIYNSSNGPLKLNDFSFNYVSGMFSSYDQSAVSIEYKEIPLGSLSGDVVVPAGGIVVVWVKNDDSDDVTEEQEAAFNEYYGLAGDDALVAGKNLFKFKTAMPDTNGAGGRNSRGIAIKDAATGEIVTQAFFNLNPDGTLLPKNSSLIPENNGRSINYLPVSEQMAALNNTVWQKMYHYNVYACSPGKVAKYQVAQTPYAELPPAIAAEEGFVHTFIDEQAETFDLNELFTIEWNDYTSSDVNITYRVTRGGEEVEVSDDLTIPEAAGEYVLSIVIAAKDGVEVSAEISFTMTMLEYREPPQFANVQTSAEITVGRDQAMADLRSLYELSLGEFAENEFEISYTVTVPGRDVEVFGHFINAFEGTYTVTVTLHSPKGEFDDVVSDAITLKIIKQAPEIAGKDQNGDPAEGDVRFVLTSPRQSVNVYDLFEVNGNAYVLSQYNVSYAVLLGGEAVAVADDTFVPQAGEYTIAIEVSPVTEGDFADVSKEIKVVFVLQTPSLTVGDASGTASDGDVDLSDYVTVSFGGYDAEDVLVEYTVTRGGENVAVADGCIDAQAGTYNVTVTLKSADGSFADVSDSFVLTLAGGENAEQETGGGCTAALAGTAFAGTALIAAGAAALLLRRRKRG